MFKKVLIANRGVIAVRIQKACENLGVQTVAVYTPEDKNSIHVCNPVNADAYCIRDYSEIPEIISVANKCGVDAIHPGVGFLSENPDFVFDVLGCGINFIGPSLRCIKRMGDKIQARKIAASANVPIVPGTDYPISEKEAKNIAEKIGFPLVLKASAGGGGMGIKRVDKEQELIDAFRAVKNDAEQLFNNDDVYIERFIEGSRHLEVQVLGDDYGNIVHLGVRDCSEQRRNQKLFEFSPPELTAGILSKLTNSALRIANKIGYKNAGTVEYLLDKAGNLYFIEVNARIQVEHRVTEMVTGIDLIAEQLRLASGEQIGYSQHNVCSEGFSIECRINAEDPENFESCPGLITRFIPPEEEDGLIVDTYIPQMVGGIYQIAERYDSLLANVIVHGKSKKEAIEKMKSALNKFEILGEGVKTTIPFHLKRLERFDY